MLKRFLISFAGGLAAIWLSVALFFILIISFIVAISISSISKEAPTISQHSVLHLKLSGDIEERVEMPSFSEIITSQEVEMTQGLNQIVAAIDAAADDKNIDGIYIDADGASAGLATRFAIIEALNRFKKSGKWIIAYADSYSQGDYLIASAADSIFVNPQGEISISGLTSQTMFFKNLLDKIGVEMQIVKVGTYKSAVEPFISDHMSDASREQQESYINGIWSTIVAQISKARKVDAATVNMWADSICGTWGADRLVKAKLANKAIYRHQAEETVAKLSSQKKVDDINLLSPEQYCTIKGIPADKGKKKIAVLYACGDIVDSGKGGIVGDEMVPLIEEIIEDDDVAGLILRVNSGGGSAFASEQIWEALQRFKATGRPFYASMGDVAASGGYYISCGADKIFAQPQTLTGSIGIFGMIPCAKDLMSQHLGITTGTVSSNPAGGVITIDEPLTPHQRNALQRRINEGYETFVKRCADGRHKTVAQIKEIAEGRVWDGQQALKIGLVDYMGSLNNAVDVMAKELKLDKYTLAEYPTDELSMFMQLVQSAKQMEAKAIKQQFGDSYELYRAANRLTHLEPVQCRMEPIILK